MVAGECVSEADRSPRICLSSKTPLGWVAAAGP